MSVDPHRLTFVGSGPRLQAHCSCGWRWREPEGAKGRMKRATLAFECHVRLAEKRKS
jgi:hypothetical protein